jgi:hypothetical protein
MSLTRCRCQRLRPHGRRLVELRAVSTSFAAARSLGAMSVPAAPHQVDERLSKLEHHVGPVELVDQHEALRVDRVGVAQLPHADRALWIEQWKNSGSRRESVLPGPLPLFRRSQTRLHEREG